MDKKQGDRKTDSGRAKLIELVRKYRSEAIEAKSQLEQLHQQSQQLFARNSEAEKRVEESQKTLRKALSSERVKTILASRGVKRVDQAARLIEPDVDLQQDVDGMVDRWLAENPHFIPASRDSGSGLHPGMTVFPGVSIDQLDKNVSRKIDFIARYGPEAFVRLARNRARK